MKCRFKVEDAKITKDDLVAWACIRLDRLQQGYRFIHLFDVKGNVTPGMLLVKIEKKLTLESPAAVVPIASPPLSSPPVKEVSPPPAKVANIVIPVPSTTPTLPSTILAEPSKAPDSKPAEAKDKPPEGVEPTRVAAELKAAQAVNPAAVPLPTPTPSEPVVDNPILESSVSRTTPESTATRIITPDTPALAVSPIAEAKK